MKTKSKWIGIGGLKCSCCRVTNSAKTKKLVNRENRRKVNVSMAAEKTLRN